ncbi:MAG: NADH-quinone oxidoreductase subunit NuoG [Proteobacteria bacterium]|nr:NADH-quinone oxidoreductase subunit NuoG [Pseudomonadota bacterium]
MPVIHIDGQEYEVEAGQNILQACLSLGLDLPYFCWHPAMGSIGACRQCAVVQYLNPEDNRGRIVMGCMTPVMDGAIFSLNGDKASEFRRTIVESLMLNHPHDCPVCAEGGECHLQDMTVMVGHRDRQYRGKKNTHRNQYLGPLIHHEMNRCITCYRCTRFYNDYAGGTDLAAMAAHDHTYFGRHEEGVLQSEFAGNLVEVCPTGVFTDKSLMKGYTRKWDLQSAPSVCTGCAVGCNTLPGERYGKLKRVHNRFNAEVNGYFLCDRGRFGAAFVNSEKSLEYPGLRGEDGRFNALDHHSALMHMVHACHAEEGKNKVAGIGSPRASVEANYLLRLLVGAENFAPGFSDREQPLIELALALQQDSPALIPDIQTIESADAILILGEDLTNTAPRIALALRQSVRNKAYELAAELRLEAWQDAAIRNLAQDQRSPLFIASVADSRLDDIAEDRVALAPDDIARLGFAVAKLIGGENISELEPELQARAQAIATALQNAQRPLIISGTGCGNAAVMQAAAQIAQALCQAHNRAMLALAVPEANSLGQAMLTGPGAQSLAQLSKRAAAGKLDTLIILENDLYRRGPKASIDALLANVANVIVLDTLDNATLSASSLALPAASFAESEGTLVSMEGRAQRYYPVFVPRQERRASWIWLLAVMKESEREEVSELHSFDDITRACASDIPALSGITGAAPDAHFRNAGLKIPRQTHRYSGRTAMRADVSVHEPKQPVDEESPLAFSMEGLNRSQPGSLLPFVWAPGWNSNQSLHKFQSEVGGHLKGGTAGARLLLPATGTSASTATQPDATLAPSAPQQPGQWQMVPRYKIFGSDELSVHSPAIAELVDPGFIEISSDDARALGVNDGEGLVLNKPDNASQGELLTIAVATLEVRLNDSIAVGCAGYSVGLAGTEDIIAADKLVLSKADNWKRHKPQIIGSDGGGSTGGDHV